jgi:hypothetical protein
VLIGGEATSQDVAMLAVLAHHAVTCGAGQVEGLAATFFVSLTKFDL